MNGSDHLDLMLAMIRAAPSLPGARCRGRHAMFDEARHGENPAAVAQRHTQALNLCQGCPSLPRCERWFDSLPKGQRPTGVIAGRVHSPKVGRPRKETA